jgi:hypothetical protein
MPPDRRPDLSGLYIADDWTKMEEGPPDIQRAFLLISTSGRV